ncbi:NF-kappa-B inhibitor cactus-like [Microplitis mediator]|uniref:NF-kappa-B inhibitor cactus-like n=1 Tax=Microplitis mediator TaxID=375433 RepID=UPI0025538BAC|nr:NF-kappa-B inhibitor cactus-like [Microplitis mediator]
MDTSKIKKLFERNLYTGENFFHEIARSGDWMWLYEVGHLVDNTTKSLLQEPNYKGENCVHVAASSKRGPQAILLIELLVKMGANLNAGNSCAGDTVLHQVVYNKDYQLAAWLCKQSSINLERQNHARLTPFQTALGDIKMMKILRTHGAIARGVSDSDEEEEKSDSA